MDVRIENHGSLFLVHPLTPCATQWIQENILEESQSFGDALVVEPRYIEVLVQGMVNDGLEVE